MTKVFDYHDIIQQIDRELARINWNTEQAKDYLDFAYGVTSRARLSDQELLEFLDFLRNYNPVNKFKIKLSKLELPKLTRIAF